MSSYEEEIEDQGLYNEDVEEEGRGENNNAYSDGDQEE